VRESTLGITQWLEKTVRAYPDQWNWMNIHWHPPSTDRLVENDRPYQTASGEKPSQQKETK